MVPLAPHSAVAVVAGDEFAAAGVEGNISACMSVAGDVGMFGAVSG